MERISTHPLFLHIVMGRLPRPTSFTLRHPTLPLLPHFLLHLPFLPSYPVGRKLRAAPLLPLPAPLLIGGLLHQALQTVSPVTPELAWWSTRLKDKLLLGKMGVLLRPPLALWALRRSPWPSVLQRAPLPSVVPHLWWATLQGRTGEKGTVV